MEYLVDMTTHVPDGTPDQAVDDIRAREAAQEVMVARLANADARDRSTR
jgi:muconolactone D-isomerase